MVLRLLLGFVLLLPLGSLRGQVTSQDLFWQARADWDAGRFVQALEGFESILLGSQGEDFVDRIAAVTGEVFLVGEIDTDGEAVRWSPDGHFIAYESESEEGVQTKVLKVDEEADDPWVREVASFVGQGLAFSSAGNEAAYLQVVESPALEVERARLVAEYGGSDRMSRMRLRAAMAELDAMHTRVVIRDLDSGQEVAVQPQGSGVEAVYFGTDGSLITVGPGESEGGTGIFLLNRDGSVTPLAQATGSITDLFFLGGGDFLVYSMDRQGFAVKHLPSGTVSEFPGSVPTPHPSGRFLAYLDRDAADGRVMALDLGVPSPVSSVLAELPFPISAGSSKACTACPELSGLAFSPAGNRLVVQARPREDWELFLFELSGLEVSGEPVQVTREIQHDLYPVFLADGRLLAMKGEGRHRRAHLYDLEGGTDLWLFRNNTTRTVAPEYEWAPSPDGKRILIVAERDGNTVSPERGVYMLDLERNVTRDQVLARVRANLASERTLRVRAEAMYGPIQDEVRQAVDRISTTRLFRYEEDLFQFGSKNVTQPGNAQAIDYLTERLREFGYEPELQWFDARGVESANVVVRIPGSVSPEVVYAVSAHFDSNTRSPGADDNTSATVGLLEMARVLKGHPLPATVEIALFTGEESGLLGSREYVRRAVASGKRLVGALNNDMVGFAEDHRLDNTIRYSNKGIRDLQHGAAILFSRMVTHDAEYYKSTDAAAYFDAYGDIVGGIGSYPILASPHYHQSHDVLETINHELVTEVAKVTTASIMLMASSPSRVTEVVAHGADGAIQVTWAPAVEVDVVEYVVAYGPPDNPFTDRMVVEGTQASLPSLPGGTLVSVKAVNARGMEGWDWASITVK